ncbi:MAG TPA: sugar ABC transporter ATP-binding protein [Solirubrobacteraceae bacterium]|nr:sugar ABC transporter ATP-binding protein [Solirubrobacteraceae bacterium]
MGRTLSDPNTALSITSLTKEFVGQRALDDVSLEVSRGEVHALLGENGAGKSTLIKVLAGVHQAEHGKIEVNGRALPPRHRPADAAAFGLHFVHQDLGLVETLSVAENIALGRGYAHRFGAIDFRATERRAGELLDAMGSDVAPAALVGELSRPEKVMVAIVRAFAADARVIVLDEVTASLPAPEVKRLSHLLMSSRRAGIGFIFVTHRLAEVLDIADRVTVLRDGRNVATLPVADVDHDRLVELIVGRAVEQLEPERERVDGAAALRVDGLLGRGLSEPISFDVARAEVVGVTGLIGSGAREVARMLGGAERPRAGQARLEGELLPLAHPARLARAGCAYVPGDRVAEGIAPDLTVRENLFLAAVAGGGRWRRPRAERREARRLLEQYRVRPDDQPERLLASLSGGNQQKVVVARALARCPRLLVLDDPTVGVDVGARVELHRLIRRAAGTGACVVYASSDFHEVAEQCDRVLVMNGGAIGCVLSGAELSAERVATESYRIRRRAA